MTAIEVTDVDGTIIISLAGGMLRIEKVSEGNYLGGVDISLSATSEVVIRANDMAEAERIRLIQEG